MVIKRKDFQKAAAFIHEFLLKLNEDVECAELRDSLNLALLHMQKYYRILQTRNQEKNLAVNLSLTARGLSPMTPFVDAPDKFQYNWINLDSARFKASMAVEESMTITVLPAVIEAAKEGNVNLIHKILSSGPDPSCLDEQDGLGRTALTYAVHFQQMAALQCLLENEANPNISAHDGSTAIHQACHDSNTEALNLLLQYGGDFTIPDTQGRAPIHWACTTPNTKCLKLLIQNNADVNIRDKDGLSPSMWACRLDHIEHFQLIGDAENFHVDDADGIERDFIGRTWMHWAVRRMEPLECLQTLLTANSASMKDNEGKTVLLTAAEMGALAACKIILEIGGMHCIKDRDVNGRNAIHLATIGGHGDVVNFLLDHLADLTALDKYNASPWDYAKNHQLHYCQLIIMSHQRQRLVSNPASPLPNGLGLMMNGSLAFSKGDFDASMDFDYASTRGSVDSMPITPPHPPKRPRTSRMPVRRSHSLGSDKDRILANNKQQIPGNLSRDSTMMTTNYTRESSMDRVSDRYFSRESSMTTMNYNEPSMDQVSDRFEQSLDRGNKTEMLMERNRNDAAIDRSGRVINHPSEEIKTGRQKERIEVAPFTKRTSYDSYLNHNDNNSREEIAMATDDVYEILEPDDLDGVSGGMDVSDIEDDDHVVPPQTSHTYPARHVQGPGPPSHHFTAPPGSQPNFHPAPPGPRYAPRPPGAYNFAQTMPTVHKRSAEYGSEPLGMDMQHIAPMRPTNPAPGAQHGPSNFFNRTLSPNVTESNRPHPAPRPPRNQQSPQKSQQRQTPSPVNWPASGPSVRDQLSSPPSSEQSMRDTRPDSGGRPPGMLEGKKILPPPMLMPLENAPRPPNLNKDDKPPKKKKKKRRDQGSTEKDVEREQEVRSPPELPENLTPPRGYAAPLHPPPSATTRPARAQSGIPPPKYSKGAPYKHDAQRYSEENMEEEKEEISNKDDILDKPPVVNGMAVPIREAPMRSARPAKRLQPMDTSYEYEMNGNASCSDPPVLQENVIIEDEDVGPFIPPPQGFRGPSARPVHGRPLSQSIPQDSRNNADRTSSAKPPLPRARQSASSAPMKYKNPSPPRRPARPPTKKNET